LLGDDKKMSGETKNALLRSAIFNLNPNNIILEPSFMLLLHSLLTPKEFYSGTGFEFVFQLGQHTSAYVQSFGDYKNISGGDKCIAKLWHKTILSKSEWPPQPPSSKN
jgi:hypothetical protein